MNVELKLVADEIVYRATGYRVYPGDYLDCLSNLKERDTMLMKSENMMPD